MGVGVRGGLPARLSPSVRSGAAAGEPGGEGLRGGVHAHAQPPGPGQQRRHGHPVLSGRPVQQEPAERRPRPARRSRPWPGAGPRPPRPHGSPQTVTRPSPAPGTSRPLPSSLRLGDPAARPSLWPGGSGTLGGGPLGRVLQAGRADGLDPRPHTGGRTSPSSRKAEARGVVIPSDFTVVLLGFHLFFYLDLCMGIND